MVKRVLLHICCGPCATYPIKSLQGENFELMGYFYNPNIHPYTEYLKRQAGVKKLAATYDLKVIYEEKYNIVEYFQNISHREHLRCKFCYQLRLEQAAHIAKRGKFDFFTTSLLVSKHQKHKWIKEIGEIIGDKYNIPFLYRDFRLGYRDTVIISKELGLYRQSYCGCLYSELERYAPKELVAQNLPNH
ncbi:MAG TPA: epoxyqueuosine reductase QueH [Syntrophomonadaceae bacterium]|nr:epoxyqueuosine reductase QueH [Syntrophomonadaceae bacterium]